jgi:hypothetical protein
LDGSTPGLILHQAGLASLLARSSVIMGPVQPTHQDHAGAGAGQARTLGSRIRSATVRALDWALPGENPAGAVYGTITVGALLAAESGLHDTYPETVGSVVVALVIYWLAHSYANLLGGRLAARRHLTARGLALALVRDWALLRGAGVPLLALLAAWAVGASQGAAVTAALWTCAVSLVAFELLAGLRTRARPAELALELCVGATMGLGVITLRVITH